MKKISKKVLTNEKPSGKIIFVAERQDRKNLKNGGETQGFGSIAQLGEHLPYKQRVIGSSPIVPTNPAR